VKFSDNDAASSGCGKDGNIVKKPKKFTANDARLLEEYFSRPGRAENALTYQEITGFLYAVACSPELIMPSEWLDLIFEPEREPSSTVEASQVTMALLSLYNLILEQVAESKIGFPPGVTVAEDPTANLDEDAPLSRWSKGWAAGHNWLSDLWEENIPEFLDNELGSIMMILSFFSNRKVARDFHREIAKGKESLEEMTGSMLLLLPKAMDAYADLGMAIADALDEFGDLPEPPARAAKVGRNEPCPCGSGVKFKKCCGAPDRTEVSSQAAQDDRAYELRVTLKNISPPVWRTFAVPAGIRLDFLHHVLQTVMGWTDSHLHQFKSGRQVFELPHDDDFPFFGDDPPPPPRDERKARLNEILRNPGDRFTYLYDFGDDWEHVVKLEKIKPLDPETPLPACLKGKRSCPPEDVGGPWGYARFLEIIVDEDHPEHEETLEWAGDDFDPELFDLGEVNRKLFELIGLVKR